MHVLFNELTEEDLNFKLSLLIKEINQLFLKIKSCKDVKEAMRYYQVLDNIQLIVARLWMKENMIIPDDLKKFVKDFDRIDDEEVQQNLFNKIKDGKYSLEDKIDFLKTTNVNNKEKL